MSNELILLGAGNSGVGVPAGVLNLVRWYDFSDKSTLFKDAARTQPVTTDGDIIKGVFDKTGNGNNFTTAATGITYKTNIRNGRSISRFDGASGFTMPAMSGNTWTVLLATKKVATTNGVLGNTDAVSTENLNSNSNDCRISHDSLTDILTTGYVDGNWQEIGFWFNGTTFKAVCNNNLGTGQASVLAILHDRFGSYTASPPFDYQGDVGEVLFYNRALSGAELTALNSYYVTKWSTGSA